MVWGKLPAIFLQRMGVWSNRRFDRADTSFARHFIGFLQITSGAGRYNIFPICSAASRARNHMVKC